MVSVFNTKATHTEHKQQQQLKWQYNNRDLPKTASTNAYYKISRQYRRGLTLEQGCAHDSPTKVRVMLEIFQIFAEVLSHSGWLLAVSL